MATRLKKKTAADKWLLREIRTSICDPADREGLRRRCDHAFGRGKDRDIDVIPTGNILIDRALEWVDFRATSRSKFSALIVRQNNPCTYGHRSGAKARRLAAFIDVEHALI